jgi:hypothetical protein
MCQEWNRTRSENFWKIADGNRACAMRRNDRLSQPSPSGTRVPDQPCCCEHGDHSGADGNSSNALPQAINDLQAVDGTCLPVLPIGGKPGREFITTARQNNDTTACDRIDPNSMIDRWIVDTTVTEHVSPLLPYSCMPSPQISAPSIRAAGARISTNSSGGKTPRPGGAPSWLGKCAITKRARSVTSE